MRRLTTDPAPDTSPCWSPNGQEIAFVRDETERTVHVVSPLGGTDRKVSDFSVVGGIGWSPDGRWIAAAHDAALPSSRADERGIFLIPVEGGEPRLIVRSQLPAMDFSPAFAPDGRRLAYASCEYHDCAVYVVELDAAFRPRRCASAAGTVDQLQISVPSHGLATDARSSTARMRRYFGRLPLARGRRRKPGAGTDGGGGPRRTLAGDGVVARSAGVRTRLRRCGSLPFCSRAPAGGGGGFLVARDGGGVVSRRPPIGVRLRAVRRRAPNLGVRRGRVWTAAADAWCACHKGHRAGHPTVAT